MITTPLNLHTTFFFFFFFFFIIIINFILFFPSIYALNIDGTSLLSFKQSQPSSLLQNWNHTDSTPCSWSGVTCAPHSGSVISLVLPSTNLVGSIPNDFARLQHLRVLDLSNNSINGTLPIPLYNMLRNLRALNLSHNYLFGSVPSGFDSIEMLDLSSNLFNGTLPLDFGGFKLNYLNLSNNKISGFLFPEFADKIPVSAVIDLSYNNFRGEIPQTESLSKQKEDNFAGNLDLCGKPLKKTCIVPSSHSIPPNVSSMNPATAAIAAIPKTAGKSNSHGGRKVDKGKIVAIVVGDVAAVVLFAVLFFYGYQIRKTKSNQNVKDILTVKIDESKTMSTPSSDKSTYLLLTTCCCFVGTEEETATEYESVANSDTSNTINTNDRCLVMVDGETELEMETLLKSSAYILGSSGGNIVYKAVVGGGSDGGGTTFAVRRIAECGVRNMKEFEKIVRSIGTFRHQNIVRIRGFYWGEGEKLVIHNYVSGGSLAASATKRKSGGYSLCNLSFEVRLKIAKGIAKGLAYIHEKKHVHGNIKPTNILLTSEMDPMISDFGLDWLISGKPNLIANSSTQNYGRKQSTSSREETMTSHDHHPHHHDQTSSSTSMAPCTCLYGHKSPYKAPESMKSFKPNPKWDVYSFGIILLELLLGKMVSDKELGQWNMGGSSISDNETRILKIVDRFVTNDVARKESILACFKLGFSCASATSQKRPSMKEALQVLERVSCPS
ncbi:receptor protein kinase-like protein At4g34220 [Rutidosis leptorrhynchoides]|uniref:receptor protein kinase-like protein At4g34220 n=1 Tax=Rutidosis leptorrhynchoides TaxID=125765 RepID=UPI003A99FA6D